MLTARSSPAAGLTGQVALLLALQAAVGLGPAGWFTGLACAAVLNALVVVGLVRSRATALGPADLVTLTRATLACGVAALVAQSFVEQPSVVALVALSVVALLLDAVDGRVARHTRTTSGFGARFDGEADAFLILVLSVYVARTAGAWVLVIGAARYAFAVAGWAAPWLRARLPGRHWRKVVAAVQGIVLTVAAADVVPRSLTAVALVLALALLLESFGRDVWWLWRHRYGEPAVRPKPAGLAQGARGRRAVIDVLALLLVWVALVAPNQPDRLDPAAFLRIPVEALAVAGLALVLPRRARRAMAWAAGAVLGLLVVLKVLDLGFFVALDRRFSPVADRSHLGPAVGFIEDSFGPVVATLGVLAAVLLVIAILVGTPLAVGRVTGLVAGNRRWSARTVAVLAVAWVAVGVSGLQVGRGEPVASADASRLTAGTLRSVAADVADLRSFETAVALDRYRDREDLLVGLRGKDVLVVFIESYGRTALEGRSSAPVRTVLDSGTDRLRRSGYAVRSGFLTSPTFGAVSWLAHSTLQSGLWVDNQLRYERLLDSDRTTLTGVFQREGWRTVALKPANTEPWPAGRSFYGFDEVYGSQDLGYRGPGFGFSSMPDQFALEALHRLELAPADRAPVMAEVDLASSHSPWAPRPRLVAWDRLGDGTVFEGVHDRARSAGDLWSHPEEVPAAYAQTIAYCLASVVSFVEEYGDDDLVLVVVGDHQPSPVVSGHEAGRDVPVSLLARDPDVLDGIAGWGWDEGLRPRPDAPVWSMAAFRDRFLTTFSPEPPGTSRPAAPAPRP